jgi:hypothetical protein
MDLGCPAFWDGLANKFVNRNDCEMPKFGAAMITISYAVIDLPHLRSETNKDSLTSPI